MSQRELADRVSVTRQMINAIERDRDDPSVGLVFKLAAFFECPIEELFYPDTVSCTMTEEFASPKSRISPRTYSQQHEGDAETTVSDWQPYSNN